MVTEPPPPILVYVTGGPATGKTTITDEVFRGWDGAIAREGLGLWVTRWSKGTAIIDELGRPRERFGGTDALPMNVQPAAEAWLASRLTEHPTPPLYAEGDRLSNNRFFAAAHASGYDVHIFTVRVDPAELTRRRGSRAQNGTWVKGRDTKTETLARQWASEELDGAAAPVENAGKILRKLYPTA